MTPIDQLAEQHIQIQKAYLVSCVNSRVQDLAAAADIVRGQRVAEVSIYCTCLLKLSPPCFLSIFLSLFSIFLFSYISGL